MEKLKPSSEDPNQEVRRESPEEWANRMRTNSKLARRAQRALFNFGLTKPDRARILIDRWLEEDRDQKSKE